MELQMKCEGAEELSNSDRDCFLLHTSSSISLFLFKKRCEKNKQQRRWASASLLSEMSALGCNPNLQ